MMSSDEAHESPSSAIHAFHKATAEEVYHNLATVESHRAVFSEGLSSLPDKDSSTVGSDYTRSVQQEAEGHHEVPLSNAGEPSQHGVNYTLVGDRIILGTA